MIKLQTRFLNTNGVKNFNQLPGPKPSIPLIGTSWQYIKFIGKFGWHFNFLAAEQNQITCMFKIF